MFTVALMQIPTGTKLFCVHSISLNVSINLWKCNSLINKNCLMWCKSNKPWGVFRVVTVTLLCNTYCTSLSLTLQQLILTRFIPSLNDYNILQCFFSPSIAHYGQDLATPINIDTSSCSPCEVSDELWNLVSTDW